MIIAFMLNGISRSFILKWVQFVDSVFEEMEDVLIEFSIMSPQSMQFNVTVVVKT